MLFAGFFKLVVYIFFGYLIFGIIRLLSRSGRPKQRVEPPRQVSGTMVKDEVCNTYLPKEEAIQARSNGRDVYFCSKECRRKFFKEKAE